MTLEQNHNRQAKNCASQGLTSSRRVWWQVESRREAAGVAVALIIACVLGRLWLEHPNFKPSLAAAVVAGALLRHWRWAVAVPLVSTLVTDWWLGFYQWPLMLTVYACLILPVAWYRVCQGPLEQWLPDAATGWGQSLKILGLMNLGAGCSAVLFFVLTSFAVWAATPWYSTDLNGLIQAYLNALPFLRWMLQGNFCFLNLLVLSWMAYRVGRLWMMAGNGVQPALPQ